MDDNKIAHHVADQFYSASIAIQNAGFEAQSYWEDMRRPSMMLRPKLYKHDYVWTANYEDIHAEGTSPEDAYLDFDKKWREKLNG